MPAAAPVSEQGGAGGAGGDGGGAGGAGNIQEPDRATLCEGGREQHSNLPPSGVPGQGSCLRDPARPSLKHRVVREAIRTTKGQDIVSDLDL